MKDYCTLRPLVVRVQARMYIFWKIDIFGVLESNDDNDTGLLKEIIGQFIAISLAIFVWIFDFF